MRINGLSGIDVDSMVKEMMKPYKIKVDKETQQRDLIKWKQDLYRDVTKNMRGIHNKYFDILSKDYILSPSKLSSVKAESKDSSILDVSGLSGAKPGTYEVEIDKLATGAKIDSNNGITLSDGLKTKLSEEVNLTFKIDGKDKEIKVAKDSTLGDLVDAINSNLKDFGVKASYSEFSNKFTIETTKTGKNAQLNATGLDSIKVPNGSLFDGQTVKQGINAQYTITLPDRTKCENLESETNSFTKDNIKFNFNSTGGTKFTIKSDVSGTVDKITEFIDDYNKLIEDMYSKVTTRKNKQGEYLPLTEEQKKDMSKEDIERWEAKGKQGILKGDMLLNSILGDMRGVFDSYTGMGKELTKMGISLTSDMGKPGQVKIDKEKLTKALEEDGENVINKLISTEKIEVTDPMGKPVLDKDGKKIMTSKGAFARLKDIMNDTCIKYGGKLLDKAGIEGVSASNDELSKLISKRDQKLKEMQEDLAKKEQAFYVKFSRLEQAMNKFNAQQSSLSQQMGGGM